MERPDKNTRKAPAPKSKGLPIDRRMMMVGLAGTAATAAVAGTSIAIRKGSEYLAELDRLERERQYKPREFQASDYRLTGFNVGYRKEKNLFALYTGYDGKLPEQLKISYKKILDELYEEKDRFIKRKKGESVEENLGIPRDKTHEYNPDDPKTSTLTDELRSMDSIAGTARLSLDWTIVQSKYSLSEQSLLLLQGILPRVTGSTLLANSATEIMPSYNGEKNLLMYDFLLQTAGKEFIRQIPSIADIERESKGPFQLTDRVETHVASMSGTGVTSLNSFEAHVHAAMELIVHNLASALSTIQKWSIDPEIATKKFAEMPENELAALVAAYHHRPRSAEAILKTWLHDTSKPPKSFSDCASISGDSKRMTEAEKKSQEDRLRVVPYISKTKANHDAIKKVFNAEGK